MTSQRITKCMVDALKPNGSEFTLWDDTASGFGVRLRPTGAMSYVVVLQGRRRSRCAGAALYHRRGRENRTGQARARAKAVLCSVAHGHDPAGQKTTERGVPTIAELADRFMAKSRDNRSASFIRRSPIPRSKPILAVYWRSGRQPRMYAFAARAVQSRKGTNRTRDCAALDGNGQNSVVPIRRRANA